VSLSGGCESGKQSGGQIRATRPASRGSAIPSVRVPRVEWLTVRCGVGPARNGRGPGGRVRLRDHGRLIWTLPSARAEHPGSGNRGEPPPLSAGDAQEGAVCRPRAHCDQLSRLVPRGCAMTWLISSLRRAARGRGCAAGLHGWSSEWGIHLVESMEIDEYGCHCSSRRLDVTEDPAAVRRMRISGVS